MRFAEGPQPALDQGSIGQDPAIEGGVVDLQAALPEQLLDVTIAQRIAQIPGDRLQDQRCLEVAALEDPMGAIGSTLLSGRVRGLNHPLGSDHASPLSST
jgi:hypothetical protein